MDFEYQALRTFADSWGLLFLTLVFAIVLVRALWPSRQRDYDDAANIPFKEE